MSQQGRQTAAFCGACGTALRKSARFCPACGAPAESVAPAGPETSSRRTPAITLGLLVLAAIVAVVIWQIAGDDAVTTAGGDEAGASRADEPATAQASSLAELGPTEAANAVGCSSPCAVTGVVAFDHPTWGASNLVTSGIEGGDYELEVVDANGSVVWSHQFGTNWYELAPNDPATDDTGHLFIDFNPGRYNGIIVLAPVEDGFEDFDTLPPYGDYNTRFYYADALDADGDGTVEVEVNDNDCNPSCAEGAITSTVYEWDGDDYR